MAEQQPKYLAVPTIAVMLLKVMLKQPAENVKFYMAEITKEEQPV